MKKVINSITTCFITMALLIGCSVDNNTIDDVLEQVQKGAILRVLSVQGDVIDLNDQNSTFTIDLEYQDGEESTLLDRVEFSLNFIDNTTTGGDISKTAPLATVAKGAFGTSQYGLPSTSFSFTYGEALTALGFSSDQVEGEDSLILTWQVFTTDGRSFSAANANGNISALGGYYSSPYSYVTAFKCSLDDTSAIFNGNFTVTFDAWADYAVGDQIPVVPDPDDPLSFRILSTNNPYIGNPTTSYMKVTVIDSDGNVSVTSNECFDYGPGFCLDVVGTGAINTCTGDINITIDFGSFVGNNFNLIKS